MGDLNAKAGSGSMNCERIIGREGCGMQNDNGERLVESDQIGLCGRAGIGS